ncbi:DUF5837 family cyanobactin class RiPP, partial [Limnospira fusiformis]
NKKNISPNPQQPVDRVPTGQLPSALAELSEAALSFAGVYASNAQDIQNAAEFGYELIGACSFDGDDE